MTALKVLEIIVMHHYIEQADETTLYNNSIVEIPDDARQIIYWKIGFSRCHNSRGRRNQTGGSNAYKRYIQYVFYERIKYPDWKV